MAILGLQSLPSLLSNLKTVAVLGAHIEPHRPAYYVPESLWRAGVNILPINPMLAGKTVFNQTIVASLADIQQDIDILNVFRRSADLPSHVSEILAMHSRPKVVWFQSGIRHDEVAQQLSNQGIDVIQDRCLMVDYRPYAH